MCKHTTSSTRKFNHLKMEVKIYAQVTKICYVLSSIKEGEPLQGLGGRRDQFPLGVMKEDVAASVPRGKSPHLQVREL